MKKLFFVLIMATAYAMAFAALSGSILYSADGEKKYSYIRIVEREADIHEPTDSDLQENSVGVIFPVNIYAFPRRNSFAKILEKEIIPLLNSDSLRLVGMSVRGAASPEGPYLNNVMLATNRSRSLYNFINSRLTYPAVKEPQFHCIPEDYDYLCQLMQQAHDPDYDRVKHLVDSIPWHQSTDCLKGILMSLDKGVLWKRLLRVYFPTLRAARIILYFQKVSPHKLDIMPVGQMMILPPQKPDTVMEPPVLALPAIMNMSSPGTSAVAATAKKPRRELLSIKTNLLFDFAYVPGYDRFCPIPNIEIEYYPLHGHFTYGATYDNPWWQDYDGHKYFQVRQYQLYTRYYFHSGSIEKRPIGKGAAFRGFYVQAYANAARYGICFDADRGWVGEGFGGGIGFGYVTQLSRKGHWRMEFGAQVGYFRTTYDPYQYECPVDPEEHDNLYYYKWKFDASLFKERRYLFNWMGPTRIGATITYDLLYRKRK